ncbi:RIP metalloprotease RseP [uncultured Sphingomonas sp.]|uniref:RIP metalloprotease RseP n=1 Tax=uncultured Sphingomonas sp. TaxID=158754 RepID=UPI0025D9BBF6|nr:RIP metalloprotease RseP [uncultured Sphingomonas sp.]
MSITGILLTVVGFIAVIGPLVFVHELGHYLAGRMFGVQAEAFSIGMGRELLGWTDRRGTRWKVAALPIGGYVKFKGDMGPASEPDPAWLALPESEKAKTLQGRPVWQRFIVVAAGPFTNFLVAILIFTTFFGVYGVPHTPSVIAQVLPASSAAAAGMQPGDRILSIGGRDLTRFEDLREYVFLRPHQKVVAQVERSGRELALPLTIKAVATTDAQGNRLEYGQLGIAPSGQVIVRMGPVQTVGAAMEATWHTVRTMVDVIGQIVGGQRSAQELGGPLRIAQFSGDRVSMGLLPFIDFVALISINLGFINLLPIPLLDGGHLFFYLVEGVRRRPLPAKVQEWAFRSGLALLLGFMMFVTFNDLGSFGVWQALAGLIG